MNQLSERAHATPPRGRSRRVHLRTWTIAEEPQLHLSNTVECSCTWWWYAKRPADHVIDSTGVKPDNLGRRTWSIIFPHRYNYCENHLHRTGLRLSFSLRPHSLGSATQALELCPLSTDRESRNYSLWECIQASPASQSLFVGLMLSWTCSIRVFRHVVSLVDSRFVALLTRQSQNVVASWLNGKIMRDWQQRLLQIRWTDAVHLPTMGWSSGWQRRWTTITYLVSIQSRVVASMRKLEFPASNFEEDEAFNR